MMGRLKWIVPTHLVQKWIRQIIFLIYKNYMFLENRDVFLFVSKVVRIRGVLETADAHLVAVLKIWIIWASANGLLIMFCTF